MKDWKSTLMSPQASILDAMGIIDAGALQIALVVDDNGRLIGTVTDGDVRRAILDKFSLDDPVSRIMFTPPTVASIHDERDAILTRMRRKEIRHIPVVDDDGRVVGLKVLMDMLQPQQRSNQAVIMAGGLGSRLRPLTEDTPKPLLKVGGKPILESIIENLVDHGINRLCISVNYRADQIKEYFGAGLKWGAEIRYLEEDRKMGTAGALGLLDSPPTDPLVVMNGDLVTKINFSQLLDFHREQYARATMCVREYDFQVPFGVIQVDNHRLTALEEKPTHNFFINAGIYVLEPDVLSLINGDEYLDMTTLFSRLLDQGEKVTVFPVREYWIDIGRIDDYERAKGDHSNRDI
jgi:dTDP-glucose pyrophosphorylase